MWPTQWTRMTTERSSYLVSPSSIGVNAPSVAALSIWADYHKCKIPEYAVIKNRMTMCQAQ